MSKLKTVYIKSIGCQMNKYDSLRLLDLLHATFGTKETDNPEEADLLLLNTCSVREKAEEKVFSDLGRWKLLKKNKPELIIGVGGCVASQEGENIFKRAPYVDIVFGPQTLHKLPQMLNERITSKGHKIDISWAAIEKFDNLPKPRVDGPCAYISIMEGCNKYCSFCIVPYTRGHEVSRKFDDVILEAFHLAEQGVKEITLLGQNVNAYLSHKENGEKVDLAILLQYLAEIKGIERLRFMTSHPKEFNANLIAAFQFIPKLANHLHLPIQSGSDFILNRMKRGYSSLEYQEKIYKLKEVRKDIGISSDFIIGFPGETEKDFQATLDIIDAIGFDYSYSFIYSKRPGTPASSYKDDVPLEIKKQRLNIIQKSLLKHSLSIGQAMVNTIQKVVVANVYNKDSIDNQLLAGRTANNRLVVFPGDPSLIGKLVDLKITENLPNIMYGKVHEQLLTI